MLIVVPQLHENISNETVAVRQKKLLEEFFTQMKIEKFVAWYYTPMALSFTSELNPELCIYDCMDELSAFKFAPTELKEREKQLLHRADIVFTGGHSLFEAKKNTHHNIHPFPSSIDKEHFAQARRLSSEPAEQAKIPHPRIGFYGVIDERMDLDLIREVATKRPDWHFVFIGPVVKIDRSTLPDNKNIHYLGGKSYDELPSFLAGWDIAIIPFALNESTRFISPTKTPEYLAAGKKVISSSIRDVVHPYASKELVHIADTADEFVTAAKTILKEEDDGSWLERVDTFLANNSWDNTWSEMMELIRKTYAEKHSITTKTKERVYV